MNTAFFNEMGGLLCLAEGDNLLDEVPGGAYVAAVDPRLTANDIWFDGTSVCLRRLFDVSVSTNQIQGLPVGTLVITPTESYEVDDGDIEFVVQYSCVMKATLEHPHFVTTTVEVPCEG
jgi:hypothetical protein